MKAEMQLPTDNTIEPDEAERILRLVTGHWPHPEMADDEIDVWLRTLSRCTNEADAVTAIDQLSAEGRPFRPNDGEFLVAYRAINNRRPRPPVESNLPQLEETTLRQTPEEAMASAREHLAKQKGPLAYALAAKFGAHVRPEDVPFERTSEYRAPAPR